MPNLNIFDNKNNESKLAVDSRVFLSFKWITLRMI